MRSHPAAALACAAGTHDLWTSARRRQDHGSWLLPTAAHAYITYLLELESDFTLFESFNNWNMDDKGTGNHRGQTGQILDIPLAQYRDVQTGERASFRLRHFLCFSLVVAVWLFVKNFKGSTINDRPVSSKTSAAEYSLDWSWSSVRFWWLLRHSC